MLKMPWTFGASLTAAACMLVCVEAFAQTTGPLIDAVHTVALPTQAVPVEESFNITTPGTYQVTLNDLGAQFGAALNSAELAVSFGNATVGTPIVSTSGSSSWSTTFSAAAAGTYYLHVIGMPGSAPGSGAIGMQVTNTANNASVASFSDTLALPSTGVPSQVGVLSDFFEVTTSGNYQITLTDMQMPSALVGFDTCRSGPGRIDCFHPECRYRAELTNGHGYGGATVRSDVSDFRGRSG